MESNDPIRRLQEVDKTTCNPNHPYAKFSTMQKPLYSSVKEADSLY